MITRVLVTGAGGSLGSELIRQIDLRSDYSVIALTSSKQKLILGALRNSSCKILDNNELNILETDPPDLIIHCAFARTSDSGNLASAMEFTGKILDFVVRNKVRSFINISSRSVYGQNSGKWTEETRVRPDTLYAMSKYSCEILTTSVLSSHNAQTKFANIRLAGLIGIGYDERVLSKIVRRAINKEFVEIHGGDQQFSYLDKRDAAAAIIAFAEKGDNHWNRTFNLGAEQSYSLTEIVNLVSEVSLRILNEPLKIAYAPLESPLYDGLDSSLFFNSIGWMPEYSMSDSIEDIFRDYMKSMP
jgi:nucleoside-diphosphate-sugar epimerase